jgi:hypothetical protein
VKSGKHVLAAPYQYQASDSEVPAGWIKSEFVPKPTQIGRQDSQQRLSLLGVKPSVLVGLAPGQKSSDRLFGRFRD